MTSESAVPVADEPACARCGRTGEELVFRDPLHEVCAGCLHPTARPRWNRLEIFGVFVLVIGSALLVLALLALGAMLLRG